MILGLGVSNAYSQTFDFSCGNTMADECFYIESSNGIASVYFPGYRATAVSYSLGFTSGRTDANWVGADGVFTVQHSGELRASSYVDVTINGEVVRITQIGPCMPPYFGIDGSTFRSGDYTFTRLNDGIYITTINNVSYSITFSQDSSIIRFRQSFAQGTESLFTATSVADFHTKFADWINTALFNNFVDNAGLQWIENIPHITSSAPAPDGLEWGWAWHHSGVGNIAGNNNEGAYCSGDCRGSHNPVPSGRTRAWVSYNNPPTNYNVGQTFFSRQQFDEHLNGDSTNYRYFLVDFRYGGHSKTIEIRNYDVPDPLSQFELDGGIVTANDGGIVVANNTSYNVQVQYYSGTKWVQAGNVNKGSTSGQYHFSVFNRRFRLVKVNDDYTSSEGVVFENTF